MCDALEDLDSLRGPEPVAPTCPAVPIRDISNEKVADKGSAKIDDENFKFFADK